MRVPWLAGVSIAVVVFGTMVTPVTVAASQRGAAPNRSNVAGAPLVELVAAQNRITLSSTGGLVYIDPGIWVASVGSSLEFRVWRTRYNSPVRITQVLHGAAGGIRLKRLPGTLLPAVPIGLSDFINLTVRDAAGAIVATVPVVFCPNSPEPEKLTPNAPASAPFPPLCATDPFPLSQVWGVERDWAVDPMQNYPVPLQLNPGTYRVTERITRTYAQLFHIPPADTVKTVKVSVVMGAGRPLLPTAGRGSPNSRSTRSHFQVPYLAHPPASALPDLVALPSWGISTSHAQTGQDLLDFAATVWIGGNGPLDVEGFRVPGSPVMKAYQYVWKNGRVIGRVRAGTMGFDAGKGHNHWHFEQFARYALLTAAKRTIVRSHKVGFCIAPSDPVDLLAPHAVWQPPSTGLGGQCGSPTALWVRETLPVGWGDTYIQTVAGQAFDITKVPNGKYFIKIAANPLGVLRETTHANDVSLREVILGGTPGNRTVTVPPWHGIDPEG